MLLRNNALDRVQYRLGAEHLNDVGPRALAEFLAEIGKYHGILREIIVLLADWSRMPKEVVRRVGGDRFPPRKLRLVPR